MLNKNPRSAAQQAQDKLLALLAARKAPTADELKQLILGLEDHRVLARTFLLEGTPFIFENRPMTYVIFREQLAEQFEIGSQDVCIVGSAKLGYSPSSHKFGAPFAETSEVDVALVSEPLFYRGCQQLFEVLNQLEPSVYEVKSSRFEKSKALPIVDLDNWIKVKDSIRNFVYQNFNPALLPQDHPLRHEIIKNMASASGLFLALEPQVFISKIRCRIFRNWKFAEEYYAETLRVAKFSLAGGIHPEPEIDDDEELLPAARPVSALAAAAQSSAKSN